MGDRRGLRLPAPADLDGHDRLPGCEGAVGQGEEPLRSLEPLEEEDDRVGLVVVDRVARGSRQASRTTSLPQPTIRENPIRVPEWMNASVTEPDWAIPITPPRGSHGFTSPM